jgi:phosphatidylserine/phosphatidylglycerophosphate/cardiolipin synthase-like enzyme
MHLKVLLADDAVTTGRYNFSANAERNAENRVWLDDPDTVTAYRGYLDTLTAAYTTP